MKKIISLWPFLIFPIIFKGWFLYPFIISSDWPFFFAETLQNFPLFPPAWAPVNGIGLGGEVVLYSLDSYVYLINWLFVSTLGLPWEIVYKIFIFGLFICLSIFSSVFLIKTVFNKVSVLSMFLSSLLFTANTYILMVVDGGQVGVALAYSVAPLVLSRFLVIIQNSKSQLHNSLLAGLVLALQVMFDARIAYITIIPVGLYYLFFMRHISFKKSTIYIILVPLGVTILLHASWILPLIISKSSLAGDVINKQTSLGAFRFFSFSYFSQSLSLLHPNWPENIFGKVYFMRSEFLFLPILAYSSLLFLQGKHKKIIAFFAILGVLGAFLAKGASEPFGWLNEIFYQYIPGMNMFRDSTKFYLLTALSYMVLIPFSLSQISTILKAKLNQKYVQNLLMLFTICYLLFLIRPVFLNQLKGTFKLHTMPQEYTDLKNFIVSKPTFFRTLWIPQQQRYNFYSYAHPAISATELYKATNSAEVFKGLQKETARNYLSDLSIQYIIVPHDSFGEIFVKDRKYDDDQRQKVIAQLDAAKWLKRVDGFGKIVVYKTENARDHFWIENIGTISYKVVSPVEYEVFVSDLKPGVMVFGESYNPDWIAQIGGKKIRSQKTKEGFNSFLIEKEGKYRIYFEKQTIYDYGRIISVISLIVILFILLYRHKYHYVRRFVLGQKVDDNKSL